MRRLTLLLSEYHQLLLSKFYLRADCSGQAMLCFSSAQAHMVLCALMSCRYAARVKSIKNIAVQNIDPAEIRRLKEAIKYWKAQAGRSLQSDDDLSDIGDVAVLQTLTGTAAPGPSTIGEQADGSQGSPKLPVSAGVQLPVLSHSKGNGQTAGKTHISPTSKKLVNSKLESNKVSGTKSTTSRA